MPRQEDILLRDNSYILLPFVGRSKEMWITGDCRLNLHLYNFYLFFILKSDLHGKRFNNIMR